MQKKARKPQNHIYWLRRLFPQGIPTTAKMQQSVDIQETAVNVAKEAK